MTGNKKRAAIYSRVSTKDQLTRTSYDSMKSHLDRCQHYIQAQEAWELVKVYEDPAESGDKWEREKIQEMLADVKNGQIDVVVTFKLDRISRSVRQFHEILKTMEENDVALVSVTQGFDTSTPAGKLLRNILIDFAQFERDMISERVKDKRLARAQKGLWNGGTPPYGYKAENAKLIVKPEEAETVKLMFDVYSKTRSRAKVREELDLIGVKTRQNTPFSKGTIERILSNPIYAGKIFENEEYFPGIHEPIIDEEMFFAVNKLIPVRTHRGKPLMDRTFLLRGLVRCGHHDCKMTPYYVNKKGKPFYYYTCTKNMQYRKLKCPVAYANADKLEAYVVEMLKEVSQQKQIFTDIIDQVNLDIENETQPLKNQLTETKKRISELNRQIDNLVEAITASGSKGVTHLFEKKVQKLQDQLASLEKKKSELAITIANSPTEVAAQVVLDHLKDFKEVFDEISDEEKVSYLQCVIQRVTVNEKSIDIRIHTLPEPPASVNGSKNRLAWLGDKDSNLG